MWELSISVDGENADCMAGLYNGLLGDVRRADGVIIRNESGPRFSVSLACEDGKKATLAAALADHLSEIVVNNFKLKFLKKHSRIPKGDPVNYNAFITALVAFDREWDKEIVARELRHCGRELLLDGFYNFRLKELRERWREVCKLAGDNAGYLERPDTFIELLRFLVGSADSRVNDLTVVKEDGAYQLYGGNGKPLDRAARHMEDKITDETVLPALILLSPKLLTLYKEGVPGEIVSLIHNLYGDNVCFIDGEFT
ncbi:MAG: putative sporulation protein YtxC [Clostridiales bacterium]|jgi:hypothetical protein|nr:putative sporulation protein YtxC [Clostridiales bacterium]